MNKKVAGALAALTATLVIGTATFVVIQHSTARATATSDAADRAKTANRIQDLHALEEAAEPTTQPTTTTTMPVTTTRPVPAIVTFPPVKAPPRVDTPKNVPPDGALATCDVPAQVQAGATTSFSMRDPGGVAVRRLADLELYGFGTPGPLSDESERI
jgi:hypothetical protein